MPNNARDVSEACRDRWDVERDSSQFITESMAPVGESGTGADLPASRQSANPAEPIRKRIDRSLWHLPGYYVALAPGWDTFSPISSAIATAM